MCSSARGYPRQNLQLVTMPRSPKEIERPFIINLLDPSRSRPQLEKTAPRASDADPRQSRPERPPAKPTSPTQAEREDASQGEALGSLTARHDAPKTQLQISPNLPRNLASAADAGIESTASFTLPVTLAGPLSIHGTYQSEKSLYAPLATVDPAVGTACSRGCEVFSAGGGISTAALDEVLTRRPVFTFSSMPQALAFYRLLPSLFGYLKGAAEQTSLHGTLASVKPFIAGTSVRAELAYACSDAADQRMVDSATRAACTTLVEEDRPDGLVGFQIDADAASDRDAAWKAASAQQGISVLAWGTIPNRVSQNMLGCSTETLRGVLSLSDELGTRDGRVRQSPNASDIAAAILGSCGRRVGSAPESVTSHLTAEFDRETEELTLSLFFPSLRIFMDGSDGAAESATQTEALETIGCRGEGKRWALAETVAAFALAVEISSLGALATQNLAARRRGVARKLKSKL
ncbi:hypothetical protein PZA11_007790 [Diplocarpon coronariae]|nr:hmg-CoA reductase [Diplocarpon mali]